MKAIKNFNVALVLCLLFFVSCQNDDNDDVRSDAQAIVTVKDDAGNILPGVTVKMYDEAAYAEFEKDNLTKPVMTAVTDSKGKATFQLGYDAWFLLKKDRFFTFVVQFGGGDVNYEIWSSGKTIRPGEVVEAEIKLEGYP